MPQRIAVLTYHSFTEGEVSSSMEKNIHEFEREMKFLKRQHYKTLRLKDVECYFERKCRLPRKSVLITMDDGWKSEYDLALPILEKYNLNATIFYIGSNYEGDNPNFMNSIQVDDILENHKNVEIASHTFSNHVENGYLKSVEELNQDFQKMKKVPHSKYFAYPYGKHSKNYIRALGENHYRLAFTFGPHKEHRKFSLEDDKYKIPRYNFSTTYPFYKYVLRLISPF